MINIPDVFIIEVDVETFLHSSPNVISIGLLPIFTVITNDG
jgi:hypothetical protein